jgi:hypothetical protein
MRGGAALEDSGSASCSGGGATWRLWRLMKEDGSSFGAPRGVTGMGFYRGSTPDVLCKDTCLILSPIAPRIIDNVRI